jgi:hypothetical protein
MAGSKLLLFGLPALVRCCIIVATVYPAMAGLSSKAYRYGAFILAGEDIVMGLKPREKIY